MSAANEIIAALVREHSAKLATYARHLGADEAFAKDAASEAFLRMCNLDEINPATAKAWLYKVCRNYVFDEFKHRARENACEENELRKFCDIAPSADAEYIKKENAQIIFDEMNRLPATQREAVFMRYYNMLEYSQIAYVLDMSVSNVGVTLNRAIAQMRKNLKGVL